MAMKVWPLGSRWATSGLSSWRCPEHLALAIALGDAAAVVLGDQQAFAGQHLDVERQDEAVELPARPARRVEVEERSLVEQQHQREVPAAPAAGGLRQFGRGQRRAVLLTPALPGFAEPLAGQAVRAGRGGRPVVTKPVQDILDGGQVAGSQAGVVEQGDEHGDRREIAIGQDEPDAEADVRLGILEQFLDGITLRGHVGSGEGGAGAGAFAGRPVGQCRDDGRLRSPVAHRQRRQGKPDLHGDSAILGTGELRRATPRRHRPACAGPAGGPRPR